MYDHKKGRRDVVEVFENIIDFLEENPTEVIVIILQISSGKPTPKELWTLIKSIEGIQERVYLHGGGDIWPTMGEFVKSGQRLIIFQHEGPKCQDEEIDSSIFFNDCHSRILDYYHWTVETEFKFNSIKEIEDHETSCIGTRGWNMSTGFYSVNNFVSPFTGPSKGSSSVLNSEEFLIDRIEQCKEVGRREPNFIIVDYWSRGDVVKVTHEVNRQRAKVVIA